MARYLSIHPDDPQPRLIRQAADVVRVTSPETVALRPVQAALITVDFPGTTA